MTAAVCPGGSPCGYADRPGATAVTLVSGATCCSWCPSWRLETGARHAEAVAVLRLQDRDSRRARLDTFEANARLDAIRRSADLALSPDEFAAESRRRVEAAIMALWHARRAAAMAPEA